MDSNSYCEGFKHLAQGLAHKKIWVNVVMIIPSACAMRGQVRRERLQQQFYVAHSLWGRHCAGDPLAEQPAPVFSARDLTLV